MTTPFMQISIALVGTVGSILFAGFAYEKIARPLLRVIKKKLMRNPSKVD